MAATTDEKRVPMSLRGTRKYRGIHLSYKLDNAVVNLDHNIYGYGAAGSFVPGVYSRPAVFRV